MRANRSRSRYRTIAGASAISFACSPSRPLVISVSAPSRRTRTVSGDPASIKTFRNPSPIDNTAMNTMTTPAMPITATADEPSRWRIVRMFNAVTAKICEIQFTSVSPERVYDPEPVRPERRQDAGRDPQADDYRDAESELVRRITERG